MNYFLKEVDYMIIYGLNIWRDYHNKLNTNTNKNSVTILINSDKIIVQIMWKRDKYEIFNSYLLLHS